MVGISGKMMTTSHAIGFDTTDPSDPSGDRMLSTKHNFLVKIHLKGTKKINLFYKKQS